jgi:nitrite reductase (NADH) small subunit
MAIPEEAKSNMSKDWLTICAIEDVPRNSGRCALLGNHQLAIFRVCDGDVQNFYALDNRDPFSQANVLSRGIVGSLQDKIVVASPVYKQHFCLSSGQCLEENVQLRTWEVRISGGHVQVAA